MTPRTVNNSWTGHAEILLNFVFLKNILKWFQKYTNLIEQKHMVAQW